MRVYAISDIHVDYKKNKDFLKRIVNHGALHGEYTNDVLLVAGDVATRLEDILWALRALASVFMHVFYCPGNHDLWLTPDEKRNKLTSEDKHDKLIAAAQRIGVITEPMRLVTRRGIGVRIIPLFSWYDGTLFFDCGPEEYNAFDICTDFRRCTWRISSQTPTQPQPTKSPKRDTGGTLAKRDTGGTIAKRHGSGTQAKRDTGGTTKIVREMKDVKRDTPASTSSPRVGHSPSPPHWLEKVVEYFHNINKKATMTKFQPRIQKSTHSERRGKVERKEGGGQGRDVVITFSHFLPRKELILNYESSKLVRKKIEWNFSWIAGSGLLDEQLRQFGSQVHVYGHSHRNVDKTIKGVSAI
ncbi:hypothetical protein AAMO2058_000404600 [Amorphochlora amoebiformis]